MLTSRVYVILVLTLSAGCANTRQAIRVERSGFLGDYSQMKPGQDEDVLLDYRNPQADFTKYDKVLVDWISVWRPVDSDLAEIPEDELNSLVSYLYVVVVEKLKEDYEIVKAPGPGVLRIRTAITETAESWVVLDTITSAVPRLRLLSGPKRLATGTHAFVVAASVECEITDARSGERLLATFDRRLENKVIRGSTSSWDDVRSAFDHWAQRLRDRLREERGADAP